MPHRAGLSTTCELKFFQLHSFLAFLETRGGGAVVTVRWGRRYKSTGGVRSSASEGSRDRSNTQVLSMFYFYYLYYKERVNDDMCHHVIIYPPSLLSLI
jgi:hypothetical protein